MEDKVTGKKIVMKLAPQWEKKYYFCRFPPGRVADPADTAQQFFTLAVQGKKKEAFRLVVPANRSGFIGNNITEL
ncbi:MAG: hypothetical protein PHF24_10905 [Syntrophomonas sp.]|nr:hypothetical protein [Syntrophomonas sp.]